LSLVISFNETDWTSGWNHLLKGATLFLTPEYELTLDPDDSIALNPNEIPLVTFRKRITSKLGKPYGSCRARVPSGLTHFEHYTKKQCMYQCLIDRIEAECNCSSILFPQNRNESLRLQPCTFIQQSICTSKFIKIFEYNTCNCPAECRKEKFEIVSHQYASLSLRDHRSMLSGRDFTILSLDLNQDEDEIITETDSASYNSYQYLSDIGGTAGLVLGLSIASVLKHMETFYFNKRDWLKEKISKRVKGWQYRNELSSKTQNDPLTTDTRVEHKTEVKSGELNGSHRLNGQNVDLNLNRRT